MTDQVPDDWREDVKLNDGEPLVVRYRGGPLRKDPLVQVAAWAVIGTGIWLAGLVLWTWLW